MIDLHKRETTEKLQKNSFITHIINMNFYSLFLFFFFFFFFLFFFFLLPSHLFSFFVFLSVYPIIHKNTRMSSCRVNQFVHGDYSLHRLTIILILIACIFHPLAFKDKRVALTLTLLSNERYL